MTARKNGEKRYLDIFQGWLHAESSVKTAYAVWNIPKGRAWGNWCVYKTCNTDMNELVELALSKHGKDPDAPGLNITTGNLVHSWEK